MSDDSLAMMPWFPGDFMRSTRGWSVTAKGVYREMLDAQWDLGALPADIQELCGMIGATAAEWAKGWLKCEPKFPVDSDGQRRNPTLEKHRAKSIWLADRRAEAGRKGGLASKQIPSAAQANGKANTERSSSSAKANVEHPIHSTPLQSESTPDHTKPLNGEDRSAAKTPPSEPEWLAEFKLLYPERGGDQKWRAAAKAGNARIREGHNPSEFLDGARRYHEFCRITGKLGTEYVKQASTFLGPGKPFLERWDPPATKADVRLNANLTAAEEFMRRTEPKH